MMPLSVVAALLGASCSAFAPKPLRGTPRRNTKRQSLQMNVITDRPARAALAGETTGVRLGRGLQVLIAANAGRDADVVHALAAHAAANASQPVDTSWALLDEYSRLVSLHEADLIWTAAKGHRSPDLGLLPDAPSTTAPVPDPFAGDDPFGAPPPEPPSTPPSDPEPTP